MQELLTAIQHVNDAVCSVEELERRIHQGMVIIVRDLHKDYRFDLPLLDHEELLLQFVELPKPNHIGIMVCAKRGQLYLDYLFSQYNLFRVFNIQERHARLLTMVNDPVKHWYVRELQRILSSVRNIEGYLTIPENEFSIEFTHWKFKYNISDNLQHVERKRLSDILNMMFT